MRTFGVLSLLVLAGLFGGAVALAQTKVPVNFVKGNDAGVTSDQVDAALIKVNEVFKPCDIQFTNNSFVPINDANAPVTPAEEGADKWTKDMGDVAKAGRAAVKDADEKGKQGKLVVVVVKNFKNADPHRQSSINGIDSGSTVLLADPFDVEANTGGQEEFWHTLAHELGHAVGLGHSVLKSDKDYANQANGEYTGPNLMAREGVIGNTELTKDQCDEAKKGAKKYEVPEKK